MGLHAAVGARSHAILARRCGGTDGAHPVAGAGDPGLPIARASTAGLLCHSVPTDDLKWMRFVTVTMAWDTASIALFMLLS